MGFFGDIGDFFKDAGNWVKNAAEDTWNGAIKPAFTGVYDVAKPVLQPVLGAVGQTGGKLINAGGKFAEGTLQNVSNLQSGFTNLVTSPLMWIVAIGAGIIILPKVLDCL